MSLATLLTLKEFSLFIRNCWSTGIYKEIDSSSRWIQNSWIRKNEVKGIFLFIIFWWQQQQMECKGQDCRQGIAFEICQEPEVWRMGLTGSAVLWSEQAPGSTEVGLWASLLYPHLQIFHLSLLTLWCHRKPSKSSTRSYGSAFWSSLPLPTPCPMRKTDSLHELQSKLTSIDLFLPVLSVCYCSCLCQMLLPLWIAFY